MVTKYSPIPCNLHFDSTLGAQFVGAIVSTFLTGIGTLQTFNYFLTIPNNDGMIFHTVVGFMWGIDMVLFAFAVIMVYTVVITNFANPFAAVQISWAESAFLATSSALNFLIRCMFIFRVWKLSGRKLYLMIILGFLNCLILSVGSVMAEEFVRIGNFDGLSSKKWLIVCVFTTIAFTDTLIAGILWYYLWGMKSNGTNRTKSQINTLIRYSLETGAVTSLVAIAIIITYLTMPNNLIFVAIYLFLPKLYYNAFMANLNSRGNLRNRKSNDGTGWVSVRLNTIQAPAIQQNRNPSSNVSSESARSDSEVGVALV
ncbi:hypothetical protein C8Q75DRAFT_755868 [Abortiporus biennis]|nr:hypothetical protein C8Q75DRAFT_755868 [Abortiporus biennis]